MWRLPVFLGRFSSVPIVGSEFCVDTTRALRFRKYEALTIPMADTFAAGLNTLREDVHKETVMCIGKIRRRLLIRGTLLIAIALIACSAFAQPQFEFHPYAGGFLPRDWNNSSFKKEGLYGFRAGIYIIDFVQADLNYAYINHFTLKDAPDTGIRAHIWDVNGYYSLNGYAVKKAEPFLTIGAGGLTTGIHDASGRTPTPGAPDRPKDNDTFFQFNYGGGIKTIRTVGPMGFRADVRGRTMPNFYGSSLTWLEVTGGINFIVGER